LHLLFSKVVLLSCNDNGIHFLRRGICMFVHAQRKLKKLNTLIILFEFHSNKSELRWLWPVCENAWQRYGDVHGMHDMGFLSLKLGAISKSWERYLLVWVNLR